MVQWIYVIVLPLQFPWKTNVGIQLRINKTDVFYLLLSFQISYVCFYTLLQAD